MSYQINLGTIITFGKYRGKELTVREIIEIDPEYIEWMVEKFDPPPHPEVKEYLDAFYDIVATDGLGKEGEFDIHNYPDPPEDDNERPIFEIKLRKK